jgi:hypothetical protein
MAKTKSIKATAGTNKEPAQGQTSPTTKTRGKKRTHASDDAEDQPIPNPPRQSKRTKTVQKTAVPEEVATAQATAAKAKAKQLDAKADAKAAAEAAKEVAAEAKAAEQEAKKVAAKAKKAEQETKKAEQDAAKDATKAQKATLKSRKESWKTWVDSHQMPDSRFEQTPEDNVVNVTQAKKYFDLKADELKCLPHDEGFNSHNRSMPTRLYRWAEAGDLAFRKEAMLAGVEGVDDVVLEEGKKMFEEKHAGG